MTRLLHAYAALLTRSFYRIGEVRGVLPEHVGLIVAANHRNGLADAAVQFHLSSRPLRPLAKSTILSMPVLSILARGAGSIPIYRKKDNSDTARNEDSFNAVRAALVAGEAVLIYPEGESGSETHLRSLKTGVARMAIDAWHASGGHIALTPMGMLYEDRDVWRSRVHVEIGSAVEVAIPARLHHANSAGHPAEEAVRELTQTLATALRAATLDVESPERFTAAVGLARHAAGSLAPAQAAFADVARAAAATLASCEPDRAAELTTLGNRLFRVDGDAPPSPAQWVGIVCLTPFSLLGLLCYGPIAALSRIVGKRAAPPDKFVTALMLGVSFVAPIWTLVLTGIAWRMYGAWVGSTVLLAFGPAGWALAKTRDVLLRARGRGAEFDAAKTRARRVLAEVVSTR